MKRTRRGSFLVGAGPVCAPASCARTPSVSTPTTEAVSSRRRTGRWACARRFMTSGPCSCLSDTTCGGPPPLLETSASNHAQVRVPLREHRAFQHVPALVSRLVEQHERDQHCNEEGRAPE